MRFPLKSILAATLCCLALPTFAQEGSDTVATELQEQVALDPHALAVLPIEVLTDDPRAPALGAEAYEAVMHELRSIDGLYVLPQESVLPYADASLKPRKIGRQLGVRWVLKSSVEASRFVVSLNVLLLDAVSGSTAYMAHPLYLSPRVHIENPPFDLDALVPDAGRQMAKLVRSTLFPEPKPDREAVLAENTSRFLDASLSDRERLQALRDLKSAQRNWPNAHGDREASAPSEPIVIAAAELAMHSDDPSVRAGVWDWFRGVDDPYLVQPLLYALTNDSDESVRWQVTNRLFDVIDEPGVHDALAYARDHDASEKVRERIRLSMLSDAERAEVLRAKALDTSLTDMERSMALKGLLHPGLTLDPELAVSMVELARNAKNPQIRSHVWLMISASGDTRFVQPLLDTLKSDRDENVHVTAITELIQFLDYPGVRTAIDDAIAGDTSPLVKKRAKEYLNTFGH